jgi:hypothetical protein
MAVYAASKHAVEGPGIERNPHAQDADALATLVIDTLLHGAGPHD